MGELNIQQQRIPQQHTSDHALTCFLSSLFDPKPNTEKPGTFPLVQILDFFRDFLRTGSRSLFRVRQCSYMLGISTRHENNDSDTFTIKSQTSTSVEHPTFDQNPN